MVVNIYQINSKFESCNYVFRGYDFAKDHGFSLADYDKIYVMEIPEPEYVSQTSLLEKLFNLFNTNRPEDFMGHSLSVSDVIQLEDEFFYCDNFGWKKIGEE